MKKVIVSTFEYFSRDPRAYKIDVALANQYDVTAFVRSEELSDYKSKSLSFVTSGATEPKNRFLRLFAFWRALISFSVNIRPDIFVAHNYYLVWPAYIIKKRTGCKVLYDSYELYVPSKRNKLPTRQLFFYAIEKYCIRSFDLVIAANEERARMMKVKFRLNKQPLSIMNISSSLFDRMEDNVVSTRYPQLQCFRDRIKLVYQGVLSGDRRLKHLIEILNNLDNRFALIYVGDGPEKQNLQDMSKRFGVEDRVLFTGRVPMKDIAPILSFCDYGIVSYPFDDYNNRYCAPNKIFEYPGAGLPMISSAQGTIVSVTRGYGIVCFVDYQKPEESAFKIEKFVASVNKESAKPIINSFLKDVSWENEADKMIKSIEKF